MKQTYKLMTSEYQQLLSVDSDIILELPDDMLTSEVGVHLDNEALTILDEHRVIGKIKEGQKCLHITIDRFTLNPTQQVSFAIPLTTFKEDFYVMLYKENKALTLKVNELIEVVNKQEKEILELARILES